MKKPPMNDVSDDPAKIGLYKDLAGQLDALLASDIDSTANLANAAAVIYHGLPLLNWAGFYLFREGMLVLVVSRGYAGARTVSGQTSVRPNPAGGRRLRSRR